ncbi:metallophosphoesterase family protein [Acuticoccus yangtzensis]|uniref:metallophosphoesterase family protein n=1 Tax=Acuticoccus yangtzensis TaxID=1443441 RepID=UPI000949709F|nr:metallophosphoesterase family protein [Acuticoccus yangtzensis]
MRVAVLADVHGNLIALDAVLADIAAAAPDLVVNLGDLVSGPYDPAGAADVQMALAAATLAGNHERQVLAGGQGASDVVARAALTPAHLAWMAALPATLVLDGGAIFACHGSPTGGDTTYLLEDVSAGRTRLAGRDAIRGRLKGIGDAGLVLCGHTHVARAVMVDGVLVVNPGSVGMPGYADDEPAPHVMEAGSPDARYALLERRGGRWRVELRTVPYDHEAAARQAERHGRADIAHVTRTGWMPAG